MTDKQHDEFVKNMERLNNNLEWILKIGKYIMYVLVVIGLPFAGATVNFLLKTEDTFAQVRENTEHIDILNTLHPAAHYLDMQMDIDEENKHHGG